MVLSLSRRFKAPQRTGTSLAHTMESESQYSHCITLLELVHSCNSNACKTRIILQKVGSFVNMRIIYPNSLAGHLGTYVL